MERYQINGIDALEFDREIDAIWARLHSDKGIAEDAEDARIDLTLLKGVSRGDVFSIKVKQHGITGPEAIDIVLGSGIVGIQIVAYDVWKKLFLPRLQERFGKERIKPVAGEGEPKAKPPKKAPRKAASSKAKPKKPAKR